MKKWNMIIDVDRCENCHNCTLAIKDEYVGNQFPGYSESLPLHGDPVFDIKRRQRGQEHMVDVSYVPVTCNHCDNAPCIKACKNGEIRKREDGLVIIDPVKAHGQRYLTETCPYGQIKWNEENQVPQTWIFDAHLLDQGWQETRVQQSCPTKAIECVKLTDEERSRRIQAENLKEWRPELNTRPRVLYKNLDSYKMEFLSGSVEAELNGRLECVESAEVSLHQDGKLVASTCTDEFGDFKFDGLARQSTGYLVVIKADRLVCQIDVAELLHSTHLGNIRLTHA
jgi:Fe-S-cluster-containing dehydrogenase component